jgi:hypothetical protein
MKVESGFFIINKYSIESHIEYFILKRQEECKKVNLVFNVLSMPINSSLKIKVRNKSVYFLNTSTIKNRMYSSLFPSISVYLK